jgi:hypothetical protein
VYAGLPGDLAAAHFGKFKIFRMVVNLVVTADDRLHGLLILIVFAVVKHEPYTVFYSGENTVKSKWMDVKEFILNSDGPIDLVRRGSFEPFREMQLGAVSQTVRVQIGRVTEADRIHDERVAVPVAD